MIALGFVILIVALFAALLSYETYAQPNEADQSRLSLLHWLTSGNWTAKAGAGLLIIGIGALIRYGILHSILPPETKLAAGMLGSSILGVASFLLRNNEKRRALCLALAGASLGVAYLTAYSAYAFFHYLTDNTAFCFLIMVSTIGCLLSLRVNAMSIAILSMLGAYIAPCFALNTPPVLMLYGYYFALSLLCLLMVWQKGWRPLIHLSFLFTLGGTLFFGWTDRYYNPQNFDMMLPILIGMTGLHVAMPIVEQSKRHQNMFDRLYIWILAITTLALACMITPDMHVQGPCVLALLAGIWALAALAVNALRQPGLTHYAALTIIFGVTGLALYVPELPWIVMSVVAFTILLFVAPRWQVTRDRQEAICVMLSIAAVLHMSSTMFGSRFDLMATWYKLLVAGCLLLAGYLGTQRKISLAALLGWMGGIWGGFTLLNEVLERLTPTMLSLLFASLGAGIMIWGHKVFSRGFWTFGALIMAAAAIKLVFFDFDRLGELENILAMIATGIVFLGVSWLVPYPPVEIHEQATVEGEMPEVTAKAHTKWIALSMGLLAFVLLYNFLGSPKPQYQQYEPHYQPPVQATPQPRLGMTWGAGGSYTSLPDNITVTHVACNNVVNAPQNVPLQCNPVMGDTSCKETYPLLCVRPTKAPPHMEITTYDGFHQWSGMEVNDSLMVKGTSLTSRAAADRICAQKLGKEWRMAEFHDGQGWGFWARGRVRPDKRFWVAVNDKPGNCWN